VCTLPSPACICKAINTRLFSTALWISSKRVKIFWYSRPAKISAIGRFNSRFQEMRKSYDCTARNTFSYCVCGLPSSPNTLTGSSSVLRIKRHLARKSHNNCNAINCLECTISASALPSSSACSGNSVCINASKASTNLSLLSIESSILMRSIPSE